MHVVGNDGLDRNPWYGKDRRSERRWCRPVAPRSPLGCWCEVVPTHRPTVVRCWAERTRPDVVKPGQPQRFPKPFKVSLHK
eukprot:14403943-Alexandrium_andersonii.AAC.1